MFQATCLGLLFSTLFISLASAFDTSITSAIDEYLAAHPIATRSETASQSSSTGVQHSTADLLSWTPPIPKASRSRCPLACSDTGLDPHGWPVYHSVDRLSWCNQTMLLDFALFNELKGHKSHISIAACSADLFITTPTGNSSTSTGLCLPDTNLNNTKEVTAQLELVSSSGTQSSVTESVIKALTELQAFANLSPGACNETIRFALNENATVAVYVGAGLSGQGILSGILDMLVNNVQTEGFGDDLLVQLCDSNGSSSRYSVGVQALRGSKLSLAQQTVQTWKNNSCVLPTGDQTAEGWEDITFRIPLLLNSSTMRRRDDECTAVQVVYGDTCTTLAAECGVTLDEFEGYNDDDLCSTPLTPGEYACCSEGTLPDYSPKPDDDDNCYVYLVETGDTCDTIAAAYSLTSDKIESYNNDTWGWMGCDDLLANMNICLSSGWPPMPTEIENAVCGPQVPDTPVASHGTNLSTLNECPLNACCDIWGQCGTTAEFCTISKSPTGAPGTAAIGENGCISNCGTEIIITGWPEQIYSVAYFEGFDWSRPCLTMSISEVDTTSYTHIHFAFATINTDYTLNITSIESQLPFFSALTDVKKILSIGGWDFSTNPDTYMIFRDAVTSANRDTLIQSIVDVLEEYELDGVDWDWEYPDEPDIPGIPAGTEADSTNYYVTLVKMKALLDGTGRTVSLTAPASFWYLQAFPIEAMSKVVDYIVYMTYDLHGQWDYNNSYADPGCPEGNCLRSHVNLTETINSLSMITKAGVSNTQLVVGVASYGRAFKMTTAGCWTEMCTYSGPDSGALAGECTETAGYLANAEIESIVANNPTAEDHWDADSFSNIIVYNDTEWVSYMNESNKAVRILLYEVYGFLGYADWAVDLQGEGGSATSSSSSAGSLSTGYIAPSIWSEASPVVTGLPGQTLVWPPLQLSSTTTITFPLWTTVLSYSTVSYTTYVGVNDATTTQGIYDVLTIPTVLTIDPVTTTEIAVWNVILPTETTDSIIYLTSSILPPPFTITVTPVWDGITSIEEPTTTTQNATMIVWSSTTWSFSAVTETVGSKTIISGGVTENPVAVIITPHPHPTTVPSTKDTRLNSKTTSWSSGSPVSPPCITGEKCGVDCGDWCDPDCPFCPPGLIGSSGGGSGSSDGKDDDDNDTDDDDNEDNSSTTTTTSTTSTSYTAAGFHIDIGDTFPTDLSDWDELVALASSLDAAASSSSSSKSSSSSSSSSSGSKTTTATSTTSTASAPSATDGANEVIFQLMELYSGYTWIFEWQLVDSTIGDTFYPCDTSPDISASADTVAPNPAFPDKDIGPFESHGIEGCQYTAGDDDDDVGSMTCPGVEKIVCEKDDSYGLSFSCDGGAVVVIVMHCYW
ncbi:hypothetical protein BDW71DRAFT_201835 [Aspergillus fruticulosus]